MNRNNQDLVGVLSKTVIDTFNLNMKEGQTILCGPDNKQHMKREHPADFAKYGDEIENIITNPDFIAKHPKKTSIEYIKKYYNSDSPEDYVLVAVRASGSGQLYARTLFVMDPAKVARYNKNNALKPYK